MGHGIYLCYRWSDAAHAAGRLQRTLGAHFGDEHVFMDTSSIQGGEVWPARLDDALAGAAALVVVIGPGWLSARDDEGRWRLDQPGDWVRREVETALRRGISMLPVLVDRAARLRASQLPDRIAALADVEPVEVRAEYWDHDVKLVTGRLEVLTREHSNATTVGPYPVGPYPVPPPDVPDAISEEKLAAALAGSLKGWQVQESPRPDAPGRTRRELCREYTFSSFRAAIAFMAEVAPGCDIAIHHPRWENVWKTVWVRLTTWDIGHQISDRDVQLAKYLDQAYRDFVPPGAAPRP